MCKKGNQVRLRNVNSKGVPATLYRVIEVHDDNTITVNTTRFYLEYKRGKRKERYERVSIDRVYIPKPVLSNLDNWDNQFHYVGDGDYLQPSTGRMIHD